MSSVQFRGTESVMIAFADNNGQGWAIFEGNKLLFKGIDSSSLEKVLSNMTDCTPNNAYATTYTLRIYEDIKDRKKINYKTEWDCSFGFKLINLEEEDTKRAARPTSTRSAEIEELRAEITALKSEHDEEGKDDQLGVIGQIFTHPIFGNYANMILGAIVRNIIPGANNMPMSHNQAAIGNVRTTAATAGNSDDASQNMTMTQIIDELQKHDPRIKDHLYKLLQIAINDNNSFLFLVNTLDSM